MVFEEGPGTDVLIAILHTIFPVRPIGARCHTPLGCAVRINHRQARLGHVGGEGRVPKNLLGNLALGWHWTGLAEGHSDRLFRGVFLHPVDIFGECKDRRRRIGCTAAGNRSAHWSALVGCDPDAPLVDRQAIGNPLIGRSRHGQPRVRKAPAE